MVGFMEVGEGGKEGGDGKGRERGERPQPTEGLGEVVCKEEGGREEGQGMKGGRERAHFSPVSISLPRSKYV